MAAVRGRFAPAAFQFEAINSVKRFSTLRMLSAVMVVFRDFHHCAGGRLTHLNICNPFQVVLRVSSDAFRACCTSSLERLASSTRLEIADVIEHALNFVRSQFDLFLMFVICGCY